MEELCRIEEVPENGMKEFETSSGLKLLVLHSSDGYHVYNGICPHQEVALCEGLYDGSVLTCHEHLWQWKVDTGEPVGLAECPLKPYPISVDDGKIYVEVEGQNGSATATGS